MSATANASLNLIKEVNIDYPGWLVVIPLLIFLPIILCLGFFANSKLQDHVISRIGIITLFFTTMVVSIYIIILGDYFEKYRLINEVAFCIILCVCLVAFICFICILQLGLDQMPDFIF